MAALLLGSASCVAVQKGMKEPAKANAAELPEAIRRDSGDIASLNLRDGSGGKEHASDPNGTYTFVKEDLAGTSPKIYVEDAQGVEWKVKLGPEFHSEVATARLLWAAGYFDDEAFYLPELKMTGILRLHRRRSFVSADVTVTHVRLKRYQKGPERGSTWDRFDNPFLGKRELNGLRVMISSINNRDLKTINNAIHQLDGEWCYLVSDLGATLDETGTYFTRPKCVLKDYGRSQFIATSVPQNVGIVMHDRLFFLSIFAYRGYRDRTRMADITRRVSRADANWPGERLSRLSAEQIRDCFRAAGHTPAEVEGYTRTVRKRIGDNRRPDGFHRRLPTRRPSTPWRRQSGSRCELFK